jgi:quercetin dioxygenase-like cupin family protein
MRLDQSFLRLPRRFCAETLAAEVRALPPSAWVPHPGNYAGNDAVLLITPHGRPTNGFVGPMAPTDHLLACPYIMEIMAEIGAVWGRSRLMGLAPGAEVPGHVDINYYWRTHLRVHIPIVTTPKVLFTCGEDVVHMQAGECWVFDSFKPHNVRNGGSEKRIHLVLDTVGGEGLWELIEQAGESNFGLESEPLDCPPGRRNVAGLPYERINAPGIMSPWEIRCHIAFLAQHTPPGPLLDKACRRLEKFASGWAAAWAQFGPSEEGLVGYARLVASARSDLQAMGIAELKLRNKVPFELALGELVFAPALPAR